MLTHYYNEFDPFAAEWLRNLIHRGEIPAGDVDTRSIKEVHPDDLIGYTQCHFFAGIAGWGLAARIAGFPAYRELWTGSCPCQPFSNAGQGGGTDDPRHLWPDFFRLIRARRPALVMGEQVASALGRAWFDGVGADLEGENYACRAVDIPACAVDAPHIRSRLYWIATRTSDLGGTPGATSERRAGRFPAPEAGEHRAGQLNGGSPVGPGDADEGVGDTHGARANIYASPRPSRRATGEPDGGVGQTDAGCLAGRPGQPGDGLERADVHGAVSVADADCEPRQQDAGSALGDEAAHGRTRRYRLRAKGDHGHIGDDAGAMAHPDRSGRGGRPEDSERSAERRAAAERVDARGFWSDHIWLVCHDGKARRTVPGLPLLVDGVSGRVALGDALPARISEDEAYHMIYRVGAWRGFGNAIVPQLAAEVIAAFLDAEHEDIQAEFLD